MDLPSDRSSGTSTFQQDMRQRILVCQQDRRCLQHLVLDLENRLGDSNKRLEENDEARTSKWELLECVKEVADMSWKCAQMKIYLERAFGAQEIQKLWGTDESLMIDNMDSRTQSIDTVAKAEHLLKDLESRGMNLKLDEGEVKLLQGNKSYPEIVESGEMPLGE